MYTKKAVAAAQVEAAVLAAAAAVAQVEAAAQAKAAALVAAAAAAQVEAAALAAAAAAAQVEAAAQQAQEAEQAEAAAALPTLSPYKGGNLSPDQMRRMAINKAQALAKLNSRGNGIGIGSNLSSQQQPPQAAVLAPTPGARAGGESPAADETIPAAEGAAGDVPWEPTMPSQPQMSGGAHSQNHFQAFTKVGSTAPSITQQPGGKVLQMALTEPGVATSEARFCRREVLKKAKTKNHLSVV